MTSQKPIAILFDWDGTLVDTIGVLLTGYNDVFTHFGMPVWDLETARKKIRTSSRETFPQMFGDRAQEALDVYYKSVEKNHIPSLKKMTGAEEFLNALKARGASLGVISNKRDSFLKEEVTHLGWDHYFSAVVGAGRASHDKPSPAVMNVALNEMGLTASSNELWYVGDTDVDMEFAANCGCKKAFISHGFGTLEEAEKYAPDITVSSLEELGKQLDTLFNLL